MSLSDVRGDLAPRSKRTTLSAFDDVKRLIDEAQAEAIRMAELRGDGPGGNSPPARAARALQSLRSRLSPPDITRKEYGLGVARGAGDLEWVPGERHLVDLFYEIERVWRLAFAEAREHTHQPAQDRTRDVLSAWPKQHDSVLDPEHRCGS